MSINITITKYRLTALAEWFEESHTGRWVVWLASLVAIVATAYSYIHGDIVAYGDAESHLNIAKRVVSSLTPGFAQLGGIWLPLPHVLLVPFVYFNFLWKSGLAGSIVSGASFVISALYLYKLSYLLTKQKAASFVAALVFIANPNILYLQSTPMTELVLIVFFVLSSYYFIRFLLHSNRILDLLFAAFFGFCASLSRYDGWGLVMVEAGILFLYYLPYSWVGSWFKRKPKNDIKESSSSGLRRSWWYVFEGRLVLYCTLAFFGIALWFLWGYLILGDPLYFTHSEFSAKSQQNAWLAKGALLTYRHLGRSIAYYFFTSVSNIGVAISTMVLAGVAYFISGVQKYKWYIILVLLTPFFFNVITLFLGQSVIFIPGLTPVTAEWKLFNVRYGVMMVPFAALFVGYLFYRSKLVGRILIAGLFVFQLLLYGVGYSKVISYRDGVAGLSSQIAKTPDAQYWFAAHYDYGLVLTDDFARTISIIRTPVKMEDVIYIGNKPYWEESLKEPEKYARWIIAQKDDAVWRSIIDDPVTQGRLYKYFNKVYTSEEILIFRRMDQ